MNCSIKQCDEETSVDDTLFCLGHRDKWRIYCEFKIITVRTPQALLNRYIKLFQLTY